MPRRLSLALAFVGLLSHPIAAQRLYRLEVGAGGRLATFDKDAQLKTGFGGALRVGYWLFGPFSVEAEAGIASAHTDTPLDRSVEVRTLSALALFNVPMGYSASLFLKAGGGYVRYGSACPSVSIPGYGICGSTTEAEGGLGVRIALTQTLLMRYEGVVGYSRQSGAQLLNLGLQGGLSFMIGSKPLIDSDHDGVYDRSDDCPDTRLGALVNRKGCPTDSDGDGVPDGLDRCPGSPPGSVVDPVGCTSDADGDGVLDGLDNCPNTPAGATVDAAGCPQDADADGVFDGLDRCPGTAAGVQVDGLGCPSDSDGDGVPDGLDGCPNTRAGTPVDAGGCPIAPELPAGDSLVVDQVFIVPGAAFGYRSDSLAASAHPILDSVATLLVSHPTLVADVNGYAHDRLVPADNTRLSQQRADVVKTYLLGQGVPADQVTATGLGSSVLIVSDTTEAARQTNRRTEIRVHRASPPPRP